jgi:hypothetical protein
LINPGIYSIVISYVIDFAQAFSVTEAAGTGRKLATQLKHGRYAEGWFKIRNPKYSQREGRRELF